MRENGGKIYAIHLYLGERCQNLATYQRQGRTFPSFEEWAIKNGWPVSGDGWKFTRRCACGETLELARNPELGVTFWNCFACFPIYDEAGLQNGQTSASGVASETQSRQNNGTPAESVNVGSGESAGIGQSGSDDGMMVV